jgi:hypothetical protein
MKRLALITLLACGLICTSAGAKPSAEYCGGVEAFEIRAEGTHTTCDFARLTAKKVRYVAFHNGNRGIPKHFIVRVATRLLTCRNFYVERLETILCQGHQRIVRLQYTAP